MHKLSNETLVELSRDLDAREVLIRALVYEVLADWPRPDTSSHVVAAYFVSARHMRPDQVGREISYHMTSGVRSAPAGSLLAECTGEVIDAVAFAAGGRTGVVRVAFPLRMLVNDGGDLFTTDLLHIAGGEGAYGLAEHIDIKLVELAMSEDTLRRFPGPAYGAAGLRKLTGFDAEEIAFGTILKPCTGITPEEEAAIVGEAAGNPMFLMIKEDENFLPGVAFAPLEARLKAVLPAIQQTRDRRGGKGLVFAPHVTTPPHLLLDTVKRAIEAGVNGIMFSEYYTGGSVRAVREYTRTLAHPPAIYGHNGGISCRTRHVYREVLDWLGRLDGIDFRQTAPLSTGEPLLRPSGQEWRECERVLSEPCAGHAPVMMARAGGLDQGNVIANLLDIKAGSGPANYLLLAGSAINGIKNNKGRHDPALGAAAMREALDVYRAGVFADAQSATAGALKAYAVSHGLTALETALTQRYPQAAVQ